ncbi:uncharacterized protein LOC134706820 [Mytilus trossulus]|uniref:uncharacterized protein LOC134706820 n=1 Tax=Mytilus trossulus TaxID=6551 RepID=UPI00300640FD
MSTKYSVLFFFLALANEKYFAFIQFRSLTDKSHCSKPLRTIFLRNESDEAVITWQGGIIEDCSISVRPHKETNIEQMCLAIYINNIPCDKNVTLKFINRPVGDDAVKTYLVGCNVKPVDCLPFKSLVIINVDAPYEIATYNDFFRLRLEIVVYLLPTIGNDVSQRDPTTETLGTTNGVCQLPVDSPGIALLSLEYCYKCSPLAECLRAYMWNVKNGFDGTQRHDNRGHHESHTTDSKLDVNSIIAIIGGVVTSLFIPIILLVVRRKMQTARTETVIASNPDKEDQEKQNNRQSLISEESFQTI